MRRFTADDIWIVAGFMFLLAAILFSVVLPGCASESGRRAARAISRAACYVEPLFEEVVPEGGGSIGAVPTGTTAAGYRIVVELHE